MEDDENALQTLPSVCANIRAISSNHIVPKPRIKYDGDVLTDPALSRNNHDDTTSFPIDSVIERNKILHNSSLVTKIGICTSERIIARAEGGGSDVDLPYRIPPMKRAKIANDNEVDLIIRIEASAATQVSTMDENASTFADTKHITNSTSASSSPKTENKKNNLLVADQASDIANSSTTESPLTLTSKPNPTSSATVSASEANRTETMNDGGNVVENSLSSAPKNVQTPIASENDKNEITSTPQIESEATTFTTIKESARSKASITAKDNTSGNLDSKPAEIKSQPVVKENLEITKKSDTPAMSVIKNNPAQQAVSSSSTTPLTANQIKATVNNDSKATKNSTSAVSNPTATKKKKTNPGNKRKRSGSSGSTSSQKTKGQSSGRWTQEEHQAFLEGLTECGREWKKVALRIPTRTSAQIRSHAQKYFAKIQRDQESSATNANVVHGDLSSPLMMGDRVGVVLGDGGLLSGTIITAPGATAMAPSVRRNVERIVSDPRSAQREVEDTMEALRERYRQLQQRLEDRQQKREGLKKSPLQQQQHRSQPLSTSSTGTEISAFASPPSLPTNQKQKQLNRLARKRMHLPINNRDHDTKKTDGSGRLYVPSCGDDNSSLCSNVSSIAASRTDLGDNEIIALQVLGDALPRSESSNDLHVLGIEADGTMPSINDNISSSSYAQLAPLQGDENDNDSLMNQGASVTANDNNTRNSGDAATSGSLSLGGISAVQEPTTIVAHSTDS